MWYFKTNIYDYNFIDFVSSDKNLSQLKPSNYKILSQGPTYGVSGLIINFPNSQIVVRAHWVSALTPGLCVQRNVTDSNPGIYPTLLSLQFQVSVPYRGYFLLPVKVFENMYDILDIFKFKERKRF